MQTSNTAQQIAKFDKDMAMEQQQERIRMMTKTEIAQQNLRREWRKTLEEGYQGDMQLKKDKDQGELKELKNGPTTLNALGSHYQHQLQRQKLADQKMQARADRVAEVIQAPTIKDSAIDAMV